MDWMTLFKSIDHVVKVRKISYSEVESMPFYQFQYILDAIKEEAEKQKEEEEKQKNEGDKKTSSYSNKQFKPIDTAALMRNQQQEMKNFKPKY